MSKLNLFEKCLKVVGGTLLAPFGFSSVKANTIVSVYRFGKFDKQFLSGLRWIAPFGYRYETFTGDIAVRSDSLNFIDQHGNPIIVKSIVQFKITDPKLYIESTDFFDRKDIVDKKIAMSIRQVLSEYPFLSSPAKKQPDIRSGGREITDHLARYTSETLAPNGITISSVQINEARYSPEVESHMLAKQQAMAYIDARELIVEGAFKTVQDVKNKFSESHSLSDKCQEQLIVNLMTILVGGTSARPVLKMESKQ